MLLYVPSGGILNILLILMDILEKNMQGLPYFPFSIIAPATGALISLAGMLLFPRQQLLIDSRLFLVFTRYSFLCPLRWYALLFAHVYAYYLKKFACIYKIVQFRQYYRTEK